jgi:hypothetical protein
VSERAARVTWTVVHLVYPSLAARCRLIGQHSHDWAGATGTAGRWFFVDVLLETAAGPRGGLEFACWHPPDGSASLTHTRAWLRQCLAAGLIEASAGAPAPLVLEPHLFPGAVVPSVFPAALAEGSARAAHVLRATAAVRAERASEPVVRAELLAIYAGLLPRRSWRQRGLVWHATWLETIAAQAGRHTVSEANAARDGADIAVPPSLPGRAAYAALRPHLAREAAAIAAKRRRLGDDAFGDPAAVRIALVARLAHVQALRLWGPDDPQALLREAALVRDLARRHDVAP